jgi:tetratricopeptide (TPR) repeat protein
VQRLNDAASAFVKGLQSGRDEDDLVAQELGVNELSDLQEKYKDKIKLKLAERAEDLQREKDQKSALFVYGKKAYERGQYPAATQAFERALDEEGPFTGLGGEIQLWLALAYQACGREEDCIELYKRVEQTHPLSKIKRQAAHLRYIMEAPKLKLGDDEKIKIPVLEGVDRYVAAKKQSMTRPRPPPTQTTRKWKKTLEEEFLDGYKPPQWVTNKYVWVAGSIFAVGVACYSAML